MDSDQMINNSSSDIVAQLAKEDGGQALIEAGDKNLNAQGSTEE